MTATQINTAAEAQFFKGIVEIPLSQVHPVYLDQGRFGDFTGEVCGGYETPLPVIYGGAGVVPARTPLEAALKGWQHMLDLVDGLKDGPWRFRDVSFEVCQIRDGEWYVGTAR